MQSEKIDKWMRERAVPISGSDLIYKHTIEKSEIYLDESKKEANEYLEILYGSREGREHIKYICEKYETDKKQITKLKLKV